MGICIKELSDPNYDVKPFLVYIKTENGEIFFLNIINLQMFNFTA